MSKLLLVGPNAGTRNRLHKVLAQHWDTLATDGTAALDQIRTSRPDLVILDDIMMPRRSGLELLRELSESRNLPVVVLTATKTEANKALAHGADDYVLKPFHSKELLLRVRSLLNKSRIADAQNALRVTLQELHDQGTGRLDAKRIADYLGVPLKELARALGVKYTTAHKTPHSAALQDGLRPVKRCLEILASMIGDQATVRAWLNSPHPDLGMRTPIEVILNGRVGALSTILENALAGIPT